MREEPSDIPPRKRRWGRWILLVLVVGLAALLALPPILSRRADRQLQLRVEAIHARGEPTTPADLMTEPLVDEENAVVELREAARIVNAYQMSNDGWKKYDAGDRGLPLTKKEQPLVAAIVKDNEAVFPLLDTAMSKPGFYWPSQPTLPLVSWLLPDLSTQRSLANFLATAARADHDRKDDASAVLQVNRLMFVSRALEHHPQALVVFLVSTGIQALASDVVFNISPDLKIGNNPGDASPQQIGELISALLDAKTAHETFCKSMLNERVFELELSEDVLTGRVPPTALGMSSNTAPLIATPVGRYAAGPWIRADMILMLDDVTKVVDAMKHPDWPSADREIAHLHELLDAEPVRHAWARMLVPSFDHVVETHFRGLADRRLAATALAIRWYSVEHEGRLPASLQSLVPKYLPAVPIDPFYAGGAAPLGYIAVGPDPRIYSVAHNGIDDGGSTHPLKAGQNASRWRQLDAVTHLQRQPRDTKGLPDDLKD